MKNSLYIIAGLLIFLWIIIFFGFGISGTVNLLLVLAGFIILLKIFFGKELSKKG